MYSTPLFATSQYNIHKNPTTFHSPIKQNPIHPIVFFFILLLTNNRSFTQNVLVAFLYLLFHMALQIRK